MSARLKAYRQRFNPSLLRGASWATKCLDCGEVVTKYDFTAEESLAIAASHVCKRVPSPVSSPGSREEQ